MCYVLAVECKALISPGLRVQFPVKLRQTEQSICEPSCLVSLQMTHMTPSFYSFFVPQPQFLFQLRFHLTIRTSSNKLNPNSQTLKWTAGIQRRKGVDVASKPLPSVFVSRSYFMMRCRFYSCIYFLKICLCQKRITSPLTMTLASTSMNSYQPSLKVGVYANTARYQLVFICRGLPVIVATPLIQNFV